MKPISCKRRGLEFRGKEAARLFGMDEIYRLYSAELFGYLITLTRSKADAEDLLSETFLRALTALSSFRSESSIRTWLYAIARNVWLEHLRKSRRATNIDDLLGVYVEDSVAEHAIASMAVQRVREYLSQADERTRSIVLMRSEGFSYSEIAERTGISASSARVIEHRTRKKLKELLSKEGLMDE